MGERDVVGVPVAADVAPGRGGVERYRVIVPNGGVDDLIEAGGGNSGVEDNVGFPCLETPRRRTWGRRRPPCGPGV